MARNLCRSSCCGVVARLSDMRQKPFEFRRYYKDSVLPGVKWVCPRCKTEYFLMFIDRSYHLDGVWHPQFVLDLSYYESYNDEHGLPGERRHLCLNNAEDIQEIW